MDSCGCPIHHPLHPPDCPCPVPHTTRMTLPPLQTSPCRQLKCTGKAEFSSTACPEISGFSIGEFPASSNVPVTSMTPTFSMAPEQEDQQLTSSFTTFRPTMTSEAESTLTSEESTASSWDGQARMDTATSVLDLIRHHSLSIEHAAACPVVVDATAD